MGGEAVSVVGVRRRSEAEFELMKGGDEEFMQNDAWR